MKTIKIDGVEYNLTPIKKQSKTIILEQYLKFEVYPKDLIQHNWKDAKKVCEYLGDGWRLPSIEELHIMWLYRKSIKCFTDEYYWSSTEINNNYVWSKFFANGGEYYTSKDDTGYVRAVRDVVQVK